MGWILLFPQEFLWISLEVLRIFLAARWILLEAFRILLEARWILSEVCSTYYSVTLWVNWVSLPTTLGDQGRRPLRECTFQVFFWNIGASRPLDTAYGTAVMRYATGCSSE